MAGRRLCTAWLFASPRVVQRCGHVVPRRWAVRQSPENSLSYGDEKEAVSSRGVVGVPAGQPDDIQQVIQGIPQVTMEDTHHILTRHWKIRKSDIISIKPISGYDDKNFLVKLRDDESELEDSEGRKHTKYLFKVFNSFSSSEASLEVQSVVAEYIKRCGVKCLQVPIPVPTREVLDHCTVQLATRSHMARLQTWIEGVPLSDIPFDRDTAANIGWLCGKVSQLLAALPECVVQKTLPFLSTTVHDWDYAKTVDRVLQRSTCIKTKNERELVQAVLTEYKAQLAEHPGLPCSVLHGDINWTNIIMEKTGSGGYRIAGLCDFGDIMYSHRVCELATAVAYGVLARTNHLAVARAIVQSFLQCVPLTEKEMQILPYAAATRVAQSLVMGTYTYNFCAGNEYLLETQEPGWRALRVLTQAIAENPACMNPRIPSPHDTLPPV